MDANQAEHQPLQQLFVIGTSPYEPGSEIFPTADAKCCRPGTRLFTKGSRVMRRAIALMADTRYRADLEAMSAANALLRWRSELYEGVLATAKAPPATAVKPGAFPVESYNRDPRNSEAPSRPYLLALVTPETENADISDLLVLSPAMVRAQLLDGCLAADRRMSSQFGLPAMIEACEARFGAQRKVPEVQVASR